MGDNTVLNRYIGSRDPQSPQVEEDALDDLGVFGWRRGVNARAISLELRKRDGNILALSYAFLERALFDPSSGITLWFAGQKVLIRGRHLNTEVRPTVRLFAGITAHRVPFIQEASRPTAIEAEDGETVIDSIAW